MTLTVFNPEEHGVAEFEVETKESAQHICNQLRKRYTVQVFQGIYTVGRSHPGSRQIHWE